MMDSYPQVEKEGKKYIGFSPPFSLYSFFQCLPIAKPSWKSLFKRAREMSLVGVSNLDTEKNIGRQGAGIKGNKQMTSTWMKSCFRAALDLESRISNKSM